MDLRVAFPVVGSTDIHWPRRWRRGRWRASETRGRNSAQQSAGRQFGRRNSDMAERDERHSERIERQLRRTTRRDYPIRNLWRHQVMLLPSEWVSKHSRDRIKVVGGRISKTGCRLPQANGLSMGMFGLVSHHRMGFVRQGPFASKMNGNPAILKCCQAHDSCYETYHCNASSWLPSGVSGACTSCNAMVSACIVTAK